VTYRLGLRAFVTSPSVSVGEWEKILRKPGAVSAILISRDMVYVGVPVYPVGGVVNGVDAA
jgi:hypothetical protein